MGLVTLIAPLFSVTAVAAATIVQPAWDWEPPPSHVIEACVRVNDTANGGSQTWRNLSRFAFTALPPGPAPSAGWPVLIDFAVIDFPSTHNASCGLDGLFPPAFCNKTGADGHFPAGCTEPAAFSVPCANHTDEVACNKTKHCEWSGTCRRRAPPPPCSSYKTNATCTAGKLLPHCHPGGPDGHGNPCTAKAVRCEWHANNSTCTNATAHAPAFHGITENFPPFRSALGMGMACSCFLPNTSVFNCSVPTDNGKHPSAGKGCSLDTVAGGIWFQRIKQLLLSNGIAVMILNPYYFDGWNAYTSVWEHGFDQPVLKRLAEEMSAPEGVFRGELDASRIALHGWSGSAQMVSWSINMQAKGQLPGLGIKAGVMMAGGSHRCYDAGKLRQGVCSNCTMPPSNCTGKRRCPDHRGKWPYKGNNGCSSKLVQQGKPVLCEFCCPQYTEDYYHDHPEDYATHPATFLGQTEVDSGADSCASVHYHEEMVARGAGDRSELHRVPLERMRCFSIGQPADATPSPFAKYCASKPVLGKSGVLTSTNHTIGFAEMALPLVKFLLKHL